MYQKTNRKSRVTGVTAGHTILSYPNRWDMGSKLFLALFSLAIACAQDPTPELNKALPSWLRVGGEYRARFEGFNGLAFRDGNDDAYLLNRVRINLNIQPASWLKFVFQGQDARVFFNSRIANLPPYENPMDLRMGYVQIGDVEKGPLSVRAGRQELDFGDQRLVGSSNWSNVARTFDAVRATARYRGVRVDAFASSVVVPDRNAFDRPVTGSNLHGLYGTVTTLVPRASVEPYVFWRVAPGRISFQTWGVRWVGTLPANFDYGTEMVLQRGRYGAGAIDAGAGHWVLGYTVARPAWKPRFSAEYNYATGDGDSSDARHTTLDQLYPTPHSKYGFTDQVGWKNIHDARFEFDAKPRPRVAVMANYHNWWLANSRDALYSAPGAAIARLADGSGGSHVGQEIDFQAQWTVTRQLQLLAGIGHIFPGRFLKTATPGHSYTYPLIMANYVF